MNADEITKDYKGCTLHYAENEEGDYWYSDMAGPGTCRLKAKTLTDLKRIIDRDDPEAYLEKELIILSRKLSSLSEEMSKQTRLYTDVSNQLEMIRKVKEKDEAT